MSADYSPATAVVLSCPQSLILESLVHASSLMMYSSILIAENQNLHHHEFTCLRLGICRKLRGSTSWLMDTVLIFPIKNDLPHQILKMGLYHDRQEPFNDIDSSTLSWLCSMLAGCRVFVLWSIQVQLISVLLMQILQPKGGAQKKSLDTNELFVVLQGDDVNHRPVDTSSKRSQSQSARRNAKHDCTARSSSASSSDTAKGRRSGKGQDDDENRQPPMEPRIEQFIFTDGLRTLRLACHFHVHDPPTYSARDSDTRYSTCEGPGWHSLVLLKYVSPLHWGAKLNFKGSSCRTPCRWTRLLALRNGVRK